MKTAAWGILSTANLGMVRVIPAVQQSALCSIDANCSRSLESVKNAAQRAGISKVYGSYEAMLAVVMAVGLSSRPTFRGPGTYASQEASR